MEAIRKATAERTGGKPDIEPVSPGAAAEAKALLARLYAASGQAVLSGQENDLFSPVAGTGAVMQATGRRPAIYSIELAVGGQSGASAEEARKAIVQQALRAHAKHSIVGLTWRPASPNGGSPASPHGQLTDYEWSQLLTPGSELNKRWCVQANEAAASLKELQDAGVAVLWNPYPESNAKDDWWAGRKGVHGSADLYRGLFDRLVNHFGLHNLVWVWESAAPEPGQGSEVARIGDYFPGLLYVDAVEARMNRGDEHTSRGLAQIAVGKPLGIELAGEIPAPDALTGASGWAWFVATPATPAEAAARVEGLRKLYADPHVVSFVAAK